MEIADWQLIKSAPVGLPVIVSDGTQWTLARLVCREVQRLQCRWPFIKYDSEWCWVFSCSGYRKIDFNPTHFIAAHLIPPPRR